MSNNLAYTGVIQSNAYFLLIRVFHTNFMERQQQQAMNMTLLAGGDGRGDEQTETSAKVAAMAAQRFGVQTETPTTNSTPQRVVPPPQSTSSGALPQYQAQVNAGVTGAAAAPASRYQQLTAMIDELGKDIRPTYNANRNCQERLKRSITQARLMVRECMTELEKSRQQANASGGSQH